MGNTITYKYYWRKFASYFGAEAPIARILMLGLDNAGKTSILYKLKLGENVPTTPTVGFNIETVTCNYVQLCIWDFSGSAAARAMSRTYFAHTKAIILVVDSAAQDRFEEAKSVLASALKEDDFTGVPLLILANKQDLPNALGGDQVEQKLDMANLINDGRPVKLLPVSAITGTGLDQALEWLSSFF